MLERHLTRPLLAALADTPVILLHGARQSGKTTLARRITEREHPARYLTLDDAGVLAAASADPVGFVGGLVGPVVLDEVQRVPNLLLAIKSAVDRDRTPGRFLLTGSANVLLLPKLADALVGRMEILTLWPLSQGELAGTEERFLDTLYAGGAIKTRTAVTRAEVIERVVRGGYPEVQPRAPARRDAWYGAYVTTILQRDVRDLSRVEDLALLPRVLRLLAGQSAMPLNVSNLSRASAIPYTTLRRYLALLETAFLVRTVPAWSANVRHRLVKAPKLVLVDTGLASHLLGADQERLSRDGELLGSMLETFGLMELLKQAGWNETSVELFHFRRHAGREVDIVLEDRRGRVIGIEVKAAATVSPADFAGLRELQALAKKRFLRGVLLYIGRETVPFGDALEAVPIAAVWGGR
ncbi:MAG: ATP-binding protein [Gemmatimonadetes bacterium]|nr:ATP-binding protein [Gemmatimonadota bacterium]